MKKIYIAGKISQECETPELLNKCQDKFNNYGISLFNNKDYVSITKKGNEDIYVCNSEKNISFTHGLLINKHIIPNGTYQQYMINDISTMIRCDEVHFLPDWKDSKGAKIEHQLCLDLGIKIVYSL
jgi:hypothetical protein